MGPHEHTVIVAEPLIDVFDGQIAGSHAYLMPHGVNFRTFIDITTRRPCGARAVPVYS